MAAGDAERFAQELQELGFEPRIRWDEVVIFDYLVPVGKHAGETVSIGIHVLAGWNAVPPSGPFVSPRLLPLNPGQGRGRPWDAVHEAHGRGPFQDPDGAWEYWSRPFPVSPGWSSTDQTARIYMAHLRTLFDEIQHEQAAA